MFAHDTETILLLKEVKGRRPNSSNLKMHVSEVIICDRHQTVGEEDPCLWLPKRR